MKKICKNCEHFKRAVKKITNQGEYIEDKNYGYCSRTILSTIDWKWVWEGDSCKNFK